MTSEPLVVEVVRSGVVESTHLIDVAVVGADGRVIASAGDPQRPAAFRSCAKPIQARVAREAGWEPPSGELLALACASHSGEPRHVEGVRAILAAAGLGEDALGCPEAFSMRGDDVRAVGGPWRVCHNCSGKHAAMLAACVAAGWPLQGYLDPEHPLQRSVRASIASRTGSDGPVLVDGCGAPTMVAPLAGIARAFASIDDGGPEALAMRAEPFMVGGRGRFDTDVMLRVPALLSKGGAEGLACVTVEGVALAAKARDGSARGVAPATLWVLHALGVVDDEAVQDLNDHSRPAVLGGGRPVGSMQVGGVLRR